jgi:hypothetical protein
VTAIDDVVKHFVKAKKLKRNDRTVFTGWIARQVSFFIRRRAEAIAALVPAWAAAPGQPDLRARIEAEFTALDAFLRAQVGKGKTKGPLLPVLGGNAAADKTPKHLDLSDLALRRTTESAGSKVVNIRAAGMSWARLVKVHGIVWRAAALEPEIWTDTPGPGHTAAALAPGILDELLDRRLVTLERMQYQVSALGEERDDDPLGAGGLGWRSALNKWGAGVRGPWRDRFRVRLFEYPRIGGSAAALQAKVAPTDPGYIADPYLDTYLSHSHDNASDVNKTPVADHRHWEWNSARKTRLEWRVLHGTAPPTSTSEWRFPLLLHDDYTADPGNSYTIHATPRAGRTGATAFDALFDHTRPVTDWWERSWLWCDHVIAALHIDALLFGLRRRFPATGETTFNDLVAGNHLPPGAMTPYVQIKPVVGVTDASKEPHLLTHTNSRHFRSMLATVDDLQLGDQVIFWNHQLYGMLARGDWRLENALIMSLDPDPATGRTRPARIRMQGHGTVVLRYPDFQRDIAEKIEGGLKAAQAEIRRRVTGKDPGTRPTSLTFRKARLVPWTPYSALTRVAFTAGSTGLAQDPWWVEIDPASSDIPRGAGMTAIEHARVVAAALPKTFALSTTPGAGYTPPPKIDHIYFPLFEPRVSVLRKTGNTLPNGRPETVKESGWAAYFRWHEAKASLHKPPATMVKLMDLVLMTGDLMPGLFLRADKKFPLVRPIPS